MKFLYNADGSSVEFGFFSIKLEKFMSFRVSGLLLCVVSSILPIGAISYDAQRFSLDLKSGLL